VPTTIFASNTEPEHRGDGLEKWASRPLLDTSLFNPVP
jgi:hypothetical protein